MNHDFVLTKNYLVFCLGPILVHPLAFLLGFKSFDARAAMGSQEADPDPARAARRQGRAAHGSRPTPSSSSISPTASRKTARWSSISARYPDYLTIGEALRKYWKSDWPSYGMARAHPAADRSVDRQGRPPRLRYRHRQRVSRHQPGLCRQAPPLRLHRLQSRRPDDGPAAAARQGRLRRPAPSCATISGRTAIPASRSSSATPGGAEDDGVIVTLVFDAERKRTDIVGLDARDLAAKPLFVARLDASRAVHAARHLHAAALLAPRRGAGTAVSFGTFRHSRYFRQSVWCALRSDTPIGWAGAAAQPGPTAISRTLAI